MTWWPYLLYALPLLAAPRVWRWVRDGTSIDRQPIYVYEVVDEGDE